MKMLIGLFAAALVISGYAKRDVKPAVLPKSAWRRRSNPVSPA